MSWTSGPSVTTGAPFVPRLAPGRISQAVADPAAEHQIRLRHDADTGHTVVSCNCQRRPRGGFAPLGMRRSSDGPGILEVYRAHLPQ